MDFMKVLDKTVREIKREVNLKVLKVPEIEQKVLDATSDEPWGPHGSDLAEIARETKKFTECQMIMSVLWSRLTDTDANWRHVYKSLAVIEYLIANGADRAVDDIIQHTFQISSLSGFEYVEPNGKDVGINVRKKSETILGLLNDREKIKAVRDKAAATRDKYCGLSSTGITYKSSSASLSSSSSRNGGYGGFSGSTEGERFKDGYKDKDQHGQEKRSKSRTNDVHRKFQESATLQNKSRDEGSFSVKKMSNKQGSIPSSVASTSQKMDEDFDDFDPRGSATKSAAPSSFNQVDLFGDSLLVDLMDAPAPVKKEAPVGPVSNVEVDLFADAAFVSAPPLSALPTDSHTQQNKVDLFAFPTAPFQQQTVDLFDTSNTVIISAPKTPLSEPTNGHSFDPFAAVPLNTFAESDDFGDFTSGSCPVKSESSQSSASDSLGNLNLPSGTPSKQLMKDNFQVKSGIWADSLSRGLIDLNITAPQKVSLADVGVVGALDDPFEDREKGLPTSSFMGRAMGTGAGIGKSNFFLPE